MFAFQSPGILHPRQRKEGKVTEQGLQLSETLKEGRKEEPVFFDLINRVIVILRKASISPKIFQPVVESPLCFKVKIQSPLQRKVHSSIVISFTFFFLSIFFNVKCT